MRKTKSLEKLVPWLYLKGISTGDFPEALQALLGKEAQGFSASTVTRLKSVWGEEFKEWEKQSLKDKRYVYMWADGVHFNVRLGGPCTVPVLQKAFFGRHAELTRQVTFQGTFQVWSVLVLVVGRGKVEEEPETKGGFCFYRFFSWLLCQKNPFESSRVNIPKVTA